MGFRFFILALWFAMSFGFSSDANARQSTYPHVRYLSSVSESMSGVALPLSEEVGNSLMNNPAALARFTGMRAEPLNMNFIANSSLLSAVPNTLGNSFSMGGLSSTMNSTLNYQYGLGFSNMTAFSWNGLAVGILIQEHSNATSDGTTAASHVMSQLIPSVGYGFGLARNLVRIGYSLQMVNQASGTVTQTSDVNAGFLKGVQKGYGFSHNVSVNLAFPFTFIPTFSVIARNLGGLNFTPGGFLPRGTNTTGAPGTEPMAVDASFDFMVRISGNFKTHWYFEYRDLTSRAWIPSIFEKLSTGLDVSFSPKFAIRAGMTGIAKFSTGLSYRGEASEIGLAYYNEKTPFTSAPEWDTRFSLQYKVMFNQKAKKIDGDLRVGNKR